MHRFGDAAQIIFDDVLMRYAALASKFAAAQRCKEGMRSSADATACS
jgi:hypothetical protein